MTEQILLALAPAVLTGCRRDYSWRESAACLGADTELFFPVGLAGPAAGGNCSAKAIGGRCPARAHCLAYALDTGQTAGIWGRRTPAMTTTRRSACCTRELLPLAEAIPYLIMMITTLNQDDEVFSLLATLALPAPPESDQWQQLLGTPAADSARTATPEATRAMLNQERHPGHRHHRSPARRWR